MKARSRADFWPSVICSNWPARRNSRSSAKWSFAHLPAIPPHFALSPIEKTESRSQAAHQADQAKGRRRPHQRLLTRGAKANRFNYIAQHAKAGVGPVPVAAIDDPGRHPRRFRPPARRPRMRGKVWATLRSAARVRLAGRHHRYAGDDCLQLPRPAVSPDHHRLRADADAAIVARARKGNIQNLQSAPTGRSRPIVPARAGEYAGKWFDEGPGGQVRRRHARRPPLGGDASAQSALPPGKPGEVSEKPSPRPACRRCSSI